MKKALAIIAVVVLMMGNKVGAQITLDTVVTSQHYLGYDFYTVQISSTETKYLIEDTVTNTFSLYNMDFTPFMLNIAVPVPFSIGYEVIYVTRSLFDCDSSNIEYAYVAPPGYHPFYIMRTDGTQLFKLDSAAGWYCFGCIDGYEVMQPIRNTSAGAKLFLIHPSNPHNTYIYSLCGTAPEDVFDFHQQKQTYVKVFPNPTSNTLTFEINPPDNMNEYELVVVDGNAKEVRREKVGGSRTYTMDVRDLAGGSYFYSLCTKDRAFGNGKFVINK